MVDQIADMTTGAGGGLSLALFTVRPFSCKLLLTSATLQEFFAGEFSSAKPRIGSLLERIGVDSKATMSRLGKGPALEEVDRKGQEAGEGFLSGRHGWRGGVGDEHRGARLHGRARCR